ncbi:MAG: aas [Bacteriovoracaceae bacterium]|nr:aas [Bacteriovoracaceae bacterium]
MTTTTTGFGKNLTLFTVRNILKLRYKIETEGLDKIKPRSNGKGTLLLPNHPGLIDPVIVLSSLNSIFQPRPVMAEIALDYPGLKWFSKRANAVIIPEISMGTQESIERTEAAMKEIIDGIHRGENFLLYPSGHITKTAKEWLGSRSGVKQIIDAAPEANILLIKTEGIWGSAFTYGATGAYPNAGEAFLSGFPYILGNGVFFGPRRKVKIKVIEATDFPRGGDARLINQYLESFYNSKVIPNTWVPRYILTQGCRSKVVLEPRVIEFSNNTSTKDISEHVKAMVIAQLRKELNTKEEINETMKIQENLGMDSLSRLDLILWAEHQSGVPQPNVEAIQTVADLMAAASGQVLSGEVELKAVPKKWSESKPKPIQMPKVDTVARGILEQALRQPSMVIMADQLSGALTYRDLLTSAFILIPVIKKMPAEKVAFMLPATVAATSIFLAAQFAEKIPVQINFSTGEANIRYQIDSSGVQTIITSKTLIDKLRGQNVNLSDYQDRFFFVESLKTSVTLRDKILARLATYNPLKIRRLKNAKIKDTSVILFTSGSENLPKCVPLSQKNHLSNVEGSLSCGAFTEQTRLLSFLPPFHSFGSTVMQVIPLMLGVPIVYFPDPKDGVMNAKIIAAYKPTHMAGIPDFIKRILDKADANQLRSLQLIITGGDVLPKSVIELLKQKCPKAKIGEGYGITEAGPIICLNPVSKIKFGTLGFPLPWVEFVLAHPDSGEIISEGQGQVDQGGNLIAPKVSHKNVEGILFVRGESVMNGYLNHSGPSPFQEMNGKQFYRTGDIIRIDSEGYFAFKDRLARCEKIGGEMVSLTAIETILKRQFFDSVEGPDLAVIADKSKERTELVVVTRLPINVNDVNRQILTGLSGLSRISRLVRISELPTLGTGKINYRALVPLLK